MQKSADKTDKIFLFNSEADFFNKMIDGDNPFRKLRKIINFPKLVKPLRGLYSDLGATGIDIEKGFKALLVQFWEDYSDRQMEKAIKENIVIRWFCGFGLNESTPDHTYFCKLRSRIGTQRIADIFNSVNDALKSYGLFGNVFTFIDASAIVSKTALWEERDKAIKDGEDKLNNSIVGKYAKDKDARWGAKSKNKIWFGYKRHHAVDMRHGLITKLATTPANVLDFKTVKNICPKNQVIFTDKLYDCKEADFWIKANDSIPATIRKNNNKIKNKDLDKYRSATRMPYEGTFSKLNHRARYKTLKKVNFQCFFEAIAHNLKRSVIVIPQRMLAT